MAGRVVAKWTVVPILLAVAACAPRGGEDANRYQWQSTLDVARPAVTVTAPDGDCGSASVHESRRDGKIDCFYAWNQGQAACARGS